MVPIVVMGYPCVMSGGHFLHTCSQDGIEKEAEFYLPVTNNARVRGEALDIAIGKIVEDTFLKGRREVDYVQGDIELLGYIFDLFRLSVEIGLGQLHKKAGHIIVLFQ